MKFNEYQELANRTARTSASTNEKYSNFGLGISGEAGEVADYIKKIVYHKHPIDIEKLKKELGDVLWYISAIADVAGLELEDIASSNIKKLKERYPDGFSVEKSINRKQE